MNPFGPFLAPVGEFVVLVAEHRLVAGRIVDLVGGQVPVPQAVLGPLHRQLESLPALAQLLFGELACRDIPAEKLHACYFAGGVPDGRFQGMEVARGPAENDFLDVLEDPAGFHDLPVVPAVLLGQYTVWGIDVEVSLAQQLVKGTATEFT